MSGPFSFVPCRLSSITAMGCAILSQSDSRHFLQFLQLLRAPGAEQPLHSFHSPSTGTTLPVHVNHRHLQ
jgi:hypothetical protein